MRFFRWTLTIAGLLLAHGLPLVRAQDVDFQEQVAPILTLRCLACHSESTVEGGLNLTRRATMLAGGDTGPALVAGQPDESHLFKRIVAGEMPPTENGISQKLSAEEIAVLRLWIASGVPWPEKLTLSPFAATSDVRAGLDWWSLQPVQRPEVPEVQAGLRVQNPIDAFVLAGLEKQGMTMAPAASRRQLVRRVYFDLLGLPPTPEEANAFLKDTAPGSYERLIDQLLKSRHYGERWARHWLDVIRFAESSGYERDQQKPNIWRYRDWVIRAFNEDMPYDRFVAEQLAGDEVPWRDEQTVIATGMIRAGTWNDEPNDPADYLYERLEDMVHVSSSAFLGLTVKCARCHDHKFDPIRQTDYYRLASFFWAGYVGQQNLGGPSADQLGFEDVFGWTDKGPAPEPLNLLVKGDRHRPGSVVEPGFLSAVPQLDQPLAPPPEGSKTSHRRLQFANWITDKRNPLTARVFANRLWQHHFGQAIVRSPNNFGFKSDPPTHPELLDWIAAELMDGNWKIKRMHKLILLSSTYRQASMHPQQESYDGLDFENRHLWRQNRRRLDAESLRDAMLVACGQLNRSTGGASFYPRMSGEALEGLSKKGSDWGRSSPEDRRRRSIYMIIRRTRLLPFMTTFDFSDTTLPCGQRDVTTVAPQALALMNNHFVHLQSTTFARRILQEAGHDHTAQITRAWHLALGRPPSPQELSEAAQHLRDQEKHFTETAAVGLASPDGDQELEVRDRLKLWLRADKGLTLDDQGRVMFWRDQANPDDPAPQVASQADPRYRPQVQVQKAFGGQPAIYFNGQRKFLQVARQIATDNRTNLLTLIAVVADHSTDGGHREILSNWRAADRTTSSLYLGTTGQGQVRFSDQFTNAGTLQEPSQPSILTAINSTTDATTYQNRHLLQQQQNFRNVDFHAPYVLGTQGNSGSEYWHGDIAELLVYDRALGETECESVWSYLGSRYSLEGQTPFGNRELALASLCHVLLSTNEFIYID